MLGRVVGLTAALVVLAGCAAPGRPGAGPAATASTTGTVTTTTAPGACPAGGTTRVVDGQRVREFCGPGRAVVEVGGRVVPYPGGECDRGGDFLVANFGTQVIDTNPGGPGGGAGPPSPFASLSVLVGRYPGAASSATPATADGAYGDATITFTIPGTAYALLDKTLTLAANRTAGSFTGTAFQAGNTDQRVAVRGTFNCVGAAPPLDQPTTTARPAARRAPSSPSSRG